MKFFLEKSDMWGAVWNVAANIVIGAFLIAGAWVANRFNKIQKRMLKSLHNVDHLSLETVNKKDIEINILLDRAKVQFSAQRAYLAMFHNGDEFVDGSEIIRYSRTHERAERGTTYTVKNFASVLTTSMPEEMSLILEPGAGWREVDDLPDSRFKELCVEDGVLAVARTAIYHRGKIVGFIGLDFNTRSGYLKPENIEDLSETAKQIGYVLGAYVAIREEKQRGNQ